MAITPEGGIDLHVTGEGMSEPVANAAYAKLQFLAAAKILEQDLLTPPGSESDGDAYIMPSGTLTGAWSTYDENDIAFYLSGYIQIVPWGGLQVYIHEDKYWAGYSSQESLWHPMQDLWIAAEHWTGKYSSAGNLIYAKTLSSIGALSNASTTTKAHSITNLDLDDHVSIVGSYSETSTPTNLHTINGSTLDCYLTSTNLVLSTGIDLSSYTCRPVRVEYCKTA